MNINVNNYTGLIFDLDGTLINTELAHNYAWQQAMAKYNLDFNADLRTQLGGATSLFMAKAFLAETKSNLSPEQLVKEKALILSDVLLSQSEPLPLVELVKQQYGKRKMAVGTGSDRNIAVKVLTHFQLIDYFDGIVSSSDVTKYKPEPDTFLACAELISIKPQQCLVFEDANFGVQAAKAAGMDVYDVRTNKIFHTNEKNSIAKIKSI